MKAIQPPAVRILISFVDRASPAILRHAATAGKRGQLFFIDPGRGGTAGAAGEHWGALRSGCTSRPVPPGYGTHLLAGSGADARYIRKKYAVNMTPYPVVPRMNRRVCLF